MNVTIVNVTWSDIGRTRVTLTKFQYKYSHFVSKHCIRNVVGIAFDQFGIKVLINEKIILHTFFKLSAELLSKFRCECDMSVHKNVLIFTTFDGHF